VIQIGKISQNPFVLLPPTVEIVLQLLNSSCQAFCKLQGWWSCSSTTCCWSEANQVIEKLEFAKLVSVEKNRGGKYAYSPTKTLKAS